MVGSGCSRNAPARRKPPGIARTHNVRNVSSRHMDVSEPLKTYAEQKANKLTKYYDRIQEIEVIFDNGKDATRVEMIVNAEHKNIFLAHHDDADAYAGIDGCVDKLERQLMAQKSMQSQHPTVDAAARRVGGIPREPGVGRGPSLSRKRRRELRA